MTQSQKFHNLPPSFTQRYTCFRFVLLKCTPHLCIKRTAQLTIREGVSYKQLNGPMCTCTMNIENSCIYFWGGSGGWGLKQCLCI